MYKVALINITLNPPYWGYLKPMVESAKKYFLPGHQVDYLTWSDMAQEMAGDIKVIPTQSMEWPMPTLMRYHLFLREEELLKQYDYIFYCDTDMEFVSTVGDEIFGNITAAVHPMYYLKREFIPPYEPNPESEAYIPRPGIVTTVNNKKRFVPLYFAGGFQGGRSEKFIDAMKTMKGRVDKDFGKNYIALWNDESHWNKYLFENPPDVVLSPSYIYPDSLNKAYYQRVWGRNFIPKIITLTKPFSLNVGAAEMNAKLSKM